jgi:hypothetical protein
MIKFKTQENKPSKNSSYLKILKAIEKKTKTFELDIDQN